MTSLIILTAEPENWAPKEIELKAKAAGFKVEVINPDKCYISLAGNDYISHDGTQFTGTDICIPRLSENDLEYKVAIVNHLEKMGVKVINNGKALRNASNKVESQILLNDAGIVTPRTTMFTSEHQLEHAVKAIGEKFPVIVKTIYGTHGIGVIRADSLASLRSIVQQLLKTEVQFILQEFIPHKQSGRILLLDGKPLVSVMRTIPEDDFRSNAHLGAELKIHEASAEEIKVCQKSAEAIGINFAAVDYIVNNDEIVVLEVNGSPGFESMQKVVPDLDIAAVIINYCIETLKATDVKELPTDKPTPAKKIDKDEHELKDVEAEEEKDVKVEVDIKVEPEAEIEKPHLDKEPDGDADDEVEVPTHSEEAGVIGTVSHVIIKHFNNEEPLEARVDTGAAMSSIHGEDIKIDDSSVRFKFKGTVYKFHLVRTSKIKQVDANDISERPVIRVDLTVNNQTLRNVEINVTSREDMKYDVLLGRNTLAQAGFLVNPAVGNITPIEGNKELKKQEEE
jgi:ribosomal protein S6--L-glutamate ligase